MPQKERTSPQYESFHELYKNYTTKELTKKAKLLKLVNYSKLNKKELVLAIMEAQMEQDGNYYMEGILDDIQPDGYGFLRTVNYSKGEKDIYISASQIRRFEIKRGDKVTGKVRKPKDNEKYYGLLQVDFVNDHNAEEVKQRPHFQALTPLYPEERILLETTTKNYSTRIMDLITPIGLGQRGLIVAPPKAGKTSLLKEIANAISVNKPNAKLFILLVGERPEEVTDIERSVEDAEVVHSTFDEPPIHHVKVAELLLERTKRLVEIGEDVIVLMDSITRLARAYNLVIPPSGRTLSGGLDPASLHKPKHFFGAARNIEAGGSLTILATALVETGSRMDDMIYEEFKGTGNMELHLDRRLSERRIFPAIDIGRSSTRKEELLISKSELDTLWQLRNMFTDSQDFTERFLRRLKRSKDNKDFFNQLQEAAKDSTKTGKPII
ncbi:transcription termination factor Rho [Staphylococcus massiliensis]|uniref:Transcription termination factor Rho n=1 Tax=Staphylococcus massiliensis S46 TaxID=1229783 RepID=K9AX77_9STAP|nr:transcription termination factor Rho [Staphylococcus massiliensis]EKU47177.1 transcription termination factor Rho [Staphylococcus massiliensis S46]MCG3400183.1 transcription termination factor Rho [Staphylococcus massiliensis]MCG3402750.1 transcription termination factor Rho [Staphylococcus massiliensis]MCG3413526.1 transcription termination factor Rho [Staphylococcus massiliensis]PNZ99827.1 transcription termination factor Rho [Staphylococcus massiliensis CCUG 55927]